MGWGPSSYSVVEAKCSHNPRMKNDKWDSDKSKKFCINISRWQTWLTSDTHGNDFCKKGKKQLFGIFWSKIFHHSDLQLRSIAAISVCQALRLQNFPPAATQFTKIMFWTHTESPEWCFIPPPSRCSFMFPPREHHLLVSWFILFGLLGWPPGFFLFPDWRGKVLCEPLLVMAPVAVAQFQVTVSSW